MAFFWVFSQSHLQRSMTIPNLMFYVRLVALVSFAFYAQIAQAAGLLRDSDIEEGLSQLAAPVLIAAGLSPVSTKILVVNDDRLNAFVIDRRHIFLHSGLILRSKTPEMLQSVIAHEAAHIANGHIARRRQALQLTRNAANFGTALAVAVGAASGSGQAATGIALGIRGSATRKFLSHSRAEESSADQSALGYMVRSGINPMGMVDTLDMFVGQENLIVGRQDPYVRSHPLTRDRMRSVETMAMAHDDLPSDPGMVYWHARVVGKLSAFQRAPSWTLGRVKDSHSEDIKHMRSAIAHGRAGQLNLAIQAIDRAIAQRPNDPFYQDLKAELYMRNRAFSKVRAHTKRPMICAPKMPLYLPVMVAHYWRMGNFHRLWIFWNGRACVIFATAPCCGIWALPIPNWARMLWPHWSLRNDMHCRAALRMPKCTRTAPLLDCPLALPAGSAPKTS
jgi:predicted Zn-dependent protease